MFNNFFQESCAVYDIMSKDMVEQMKIHNTALALYMLDK